MKQNDAPQLVAKAAREIEKLLANRSKALEVINEHYSTLSSHNPKHIALLRGFEIVTQCN